MLKFLKIGVGAAIALFCASPAMADPCLINNPQPAGTVCYDLNVPTIGTAGTASSVYVQVGITQLSANEVQVDAQLGGAASEFVTTGGPHLSFAFNVNIASPTIQICQSTTVCTTPAPTEWALETGSFSTSPGGNFNYAIIDTLGNGGSSGISTPLVFDVTATGITSASFAGSAGIAFAADVLNSKGATGEVARLPEAPTPFLFGAGLLGLMVLYRRRLLKPARSAQR